MNLAIITLMYCSILRIVFFPIFSNRSHLPAAAASILLSIILYIFFNIDKSKLIIFYYSILLFILNIFALKSNIRILSISYLETMTPFLLLGVVSSKNFALYLKNNLAFFVKSIVWLLTILLFGHLLDLNGFPLPRLASIPLSNELLGKFSTASRVSSFVGTSGPYSLSLCYLFISLQLLKPRFFYPIFFLGSLVLIFSFSRLALAVFLIFNLTVGFLEFFKIFNFKNNLINKQKFFIVLISISFAIIFININLGEGVTLLLNRFSQGLNFYKDQGNISRIERFLDLTTNYKENNILNIIFGDGTGITSRYSNAPQGESQLGKVYVEWGLLGLTLLIAWIMDVIGILKFQFNKIAP